MTGFDPLVLCIPFVAGFIGWFTNWLAVKAMLYPVEFRGLPPVLGWQGVVPKNAEDLTGLTVGTGKGSYQELYLRENHPEAAIELFTDSETMIDAVLTGRIDLCLSEASEMQGELAIICV